MGSRGGLRLGATLIRDRTGSACRNGEGESGTTPGLTSMAEWRLERVGGGGGGGALLSFVGG